MACPSAGQTLPVPDRDTTAETMAGTVEWLLHGVEVRDDQLRVGDRIGREGGGMPLVHFRAQPLGRLTDVKREGCVLLNLTEMFHRIPVPSSDWETRQPRLG